MTQEQQSADDRRLVLELRALSSYLADHEHPRGAHTASLAAAHIEGHNEAFAVVVRDKHGAEQARQQTEKNLRHTNEMLDGWRQLLVALLKEHPTDMRIKRALMGEHPMRLAAWERQQ